MGDFLFSDITKLIEVSCYYLVLCAGQLEGWTSGVNSIAAGGAGSARITGGKMFNTFKKGAEV